MFQLRRPLPGVFVVRIEGYDRGEFGDRPFDLIQAELLRFGRIELFIDTRDALGAVTAVREAWTAWFHRHRAALARVHILVGSKYVKLTMDIAKELSRTGELIRVHADVAAFGAALARAAGREPAA